MEKIQDIIQEIRRLEKELREEFQKKEDEFLYIIKGKKVYFEERRRKYQRTLATRVSRYILKAPLLNILTAPIIWFCIFPALFMDLTVTAYQFICFKVYNIPKVKRDDYIVIDR